MSLNSHSGSELMEQSSQDPSSGDLKNKGLLPIGGSSQLDSKIILKKYPWVLVSSCSFATAGCFSFHQILKPFSISSTELNYILLLLL